MAKARIEKLTPEQEARIPEFRDEFLRIGLSTEHYSTAARQEAAMNAMTRNRLHVSSKSFGPLGMTAVVLLGGEYYEANERELALLQAGMEPEDLGLEPFEADYRDDASGIPSPDSLRQWMNGRVL